MESILGRKPEDLEDYYGLLGCDELSSVMTDFQKLLEAKEVLCDEAKRRNYDLWRRSGISIPFQEWRALNDSSMHWVVRTKKEPMLESCKPEDLAASQNDETSENPSKEAALCDFYHQRFRWASDSPS
ncbi:hypothetical protein CCH79_00001360, partial [Gambusia affinis]